MNALTKQPVPTVTLAPALVPANMSEAIKLAEIMASAKLVPVGLQKSVADCLMVVQQAVRWQMDPFAVAQECSIIQGKLMHSGKLVAAVVNSRGNLTQRLSYEYGGEGQNRTITVSGQLQGEAAPRTVKVVLHNAVTNNKVWQTQPDQQLMYHGVRVWARRHTPELMLGVYSPEEFPDAEAEIANGTSVYNPNEDYIGGTPEKDTKPPEPKKQSRREQAVAMHTENIAVMCKMLKNCQSIDELKQVVDRIKDRHDYQALEIAITSEKDMSEQYQQIKNRIVDTWAATLARLKQEEVADQVIIDDDGERPARPEDFAEDVVEQIAGSISQRAIDGRPPRLKELNGPDDSPDMPPKLDRNGRR